MKEKYELTVGGRLGPGLSDTKEISVLNRIIRWTPRGIEYEADPQQVEKLLHEIELEGANGAVTPGVKILAHQVENLHASGVHRLIRFSTEISFASASPVPRRSQTRSSYFSFLATLTNTEKGEARPL